MSDVCEGCKYEYTCFCAEACKECIRVNSQSFVDYYEEQEEEINENSNQDTV